MKNILNQKPSLELNGRLRESVSFASDLDLQNKNVLDIGCGFGWFELNALNRGIKKITGTEISEDDLKTAKENVINEKVDFKVASALDLPFEDNSFDTVVSWEVIEHIPKNTEDKMFSEVKRVLKPNGVFYLSTPHKSFFSNIFDPAWWLIEHRHYEIDELKKFAENNGFEVLDFKIKGGFWSLFSSLNMYLSKWIFKRKPILESYFVGRENVEYGKENGFVDVFIKFRKI
jgi:ubiquinone/menaquinone biosynthesis C-methylase UbiE